MNAIRIAAALALTLATHAGHAAPAQVSYNTVKVNGVNIFYREAGSKEAPAVLLLHGFPASSHMFRNLIPQLADRYHVIAPDYPGYGQSDMPPVDRFTYSFDNLAAVMDKFTETVGVSRYAMYVQDYGAPIGFRLAAAHPQRISAIVVQNGNAYREGIDHAFWEPLKAYWGNKSDANREHLRGLLNGESIKWLYTEGVRDIRHISPDAWTVDQAYMERPGNKDIQLEMFYSYGSNPPRYAEWQAYFRQHQPPMLIVWGKNDKTFPPASAQAYVRDLPKAELHLFDTSHFALEEDGAAIGALTRDFLDRNVGAATRPAP